MPEDLTAVAPPDGGLLFSIGAHLTTAAIPIWKFGTIDQQKRYLERLCDGSLIGVGALTEAEAGSDAFGIATSARPERDGFVLNGSKRYISNASIADLTIVYAATGTAKGYHGGITAFIVEKGSPGMTVGESLRKWACARRRWAS
jgi:alkylation response protein AidB-like acyl-CoA dehydrogenase